MEQIIDLLDINDVYCDVFDSYVDTSGRKPKFLSGELAWFKPTKQFVVILSQHLHYDEGDETFFGNCVFEDITGNKGECNGWQLAKLFETF